MATDYTKLQFATPAYNIDKITSYSAGSDASANATANISYVITGTNPTQSTVIQTIANPYNKKMYFTMSWSLDNVNFYDCTTKLLYVNGANVQTQMQVVMGVSASLIYFAFTNAYTSNQTVYIQYALDNIL